MYGPDFGVMRFLAENIEKQTAQKVLTRTSETSTTKIEVVLSLRPPLIVQGGGHGVECRADRLRAVPYEEQFCQSFLGTLCCEAGFCILIPTVLHRLFQRANRLQETVLIFSNINNINADHNRSIS